MTPEKGLTLVALFKVEGFYDGRCHANRIIQKGEDHDNGVYTLGYDDLIYWNGYNCDQPVATEFQNFYAAFGNNQYDGVGSRASEYVRKDKWYTLVYTFDPKTSVSKLYINNKVPKETNVDFDFSYSPNSKDLYIGRMESDEFPYWFNGVIDEIRIYNSVLSPKEADFVYKSINN